MAANTSAAVMAQRAEPHDSLDDFPTPPWATRALCEWILAQGDDLSFCYCREPAANRGHMVRPLREVFGAVRASDVHDYGVGFLVEDYLFGPRPSVVDWTITNPPFRLAEQFISRALETSRCGVAMLVRSTFIEGKSRWTSLFSVTPPSHVLQFSERVLMLKGRLVRDGAVCPKLKRRVTSATAYSWLVWKLPLTVPPHTRLEWIPPCRSSLTRLGDYDDPQL
ncbi:hypothetical protein CKO11_06875 [Rhodobacter sp. TJ_12]|uniref:hypothetical protein n=1 Tax=Rhodobacter sp. TJ_12 TaxID=2029399 RepID=UPI001CBE6796|nr:hypothetical protein [Rhodobacter sp. TJ_12]MBZ4022178.1 hypothetical protein [Rhodobacter sp. TJ_12]